MNVAVRTVQGIWPHSTFSLEMPNAPPMAQLSLPYQTGLGAVAVLAAAWLLLLGGHHKSTSGGGSSSAPAQPTRTVHAPVAPAAAKAHAQGDAGSATGGGSASSLGSLGHAI